MNASTSLANQFLIAMPSLKDTNFFQTVTYLCEHDSNGAMGITINRPSGLKLGDILEQLDITSASGDATAQIVYSGGPVQSDHGFVLHTADSSWDSTMAITSQISLTTSRDILEAIATNQGPKQTLVALGYAGWGGGQLEQELSANSWLNGPAPLDIIFCTATKDRWDAAANELGVDLNLLSGEPGHA